MSEYKPFGLVAPSPIVIPAAAYQTYSLEERWEIMSKYIHGVSFRRIAGDLHRDARGIEDVMYRVIADDLYQGTELLIWILENRGQRLYYRTGAPWTPNELNCLRYLVDARKKAPTMAPLTNQEFGLVVGRTREAVIYMLKQRHSPKPGLGLIPVEPLSGEKREEPVVRSQKAILLRERLEQLLKLLDVVES